MAPSAALLRAHASGNIPLAALALTFALVLGSPVLTLAARSLPSEVDASLPIASPGHTNDTFPGSNALGTFNWAVDTVRRQLSKGTSFNCFPADARVMTSLEGAEKLMTEVKEGDEVVVVNPTSGELKLGVVISNGLQGADVMAEHVTLGTSSGHVISATPDHQIFSTSRHAAFSDDAPSFAVSSKIVPAASIQVGDVIWVASPAGDSTSPGALSPVTVTSVSRAMKRGMLNPGTRSGTLVVNGVLATTFTTAAAGEMPLALDPLRSQ